MLSITAPASLNSTEGLSGRPAASKTLDHYTVLLWSLEHAPEATCGCILPRSPEPRIPVEVDQP
jgi:hypothetical protein